MTRLMKYDAFPELSSMTDWLGKDIAQFLPYRSVREAAHWRPPVDILEHENEFLIKVELPELDEKAIDMKLEKDILTLKGERKLEKDANKGLYRRVERHYGNFERSFRLPDSVDTEKVTANLKQGVLMVTLPKKEETKPKTIQVEIK